MSGAVARPPKSPPRSSATRKIGATTGAAVLALVGLATGAPGQSPATDWPQALGPNRDGSVDVAVAAWPDGGPTERWRREIGEGFAGPAAVAGKVVIFHRVADQERVEALDPTTGESLWRSDDPTSYRDDFGFDEGPRATPTIAGDRVFTCGAQGVLRATNLGDGSTIWRVDTHREFGVRKGFFGAACAPLVLGDKVLVNVGGAGAGIVAFAADTGDVQWSETDDEASYSAPTAARLNGATEALFFTRTGLVALDPDNGNVRATFRWRSRLGASVNAATPLVIGNRVFISASYGTGAALLDAAPDSFEPVWTSDDALTNHYATSVYHDGYLYGYHGRQEYSPALRAVNMETGEVAWNVDGFGGGTILRVRDRLLILRENGELILAEATPDAFRPLARARILTGVVRAYPALANGVLYARSERELVAVELPGQ